MKKLLFVSFCFLVILGCKPIIVKVAPTIISVTTTPPVVTSTTITVSGNITNDGGDAILDRGVVYGLNPNPTITDGKISSGTGIGTFNSTINGLTPGKIYYVRTYATNGQGTAYGDQVTVTTTAIMAVVTSTAASAITSNSASSGGNVTNDGGSPVTARGVCWGTAQSPTIALTTKTTDGTGTGTFTSAITGLTPGTTYYARAYATNSIGTAYGDQITIAATAILATITTTTASAITSSTATSGGSISSDGGSAITAKGVCWSTAQNPTTALTTKTTDGTGTGTFTSSITALTPGTTYYIRAYATNIIGTQYGTQVSFTTSANLPTLTTNTATTITSSASVSGGNISADGGAAITAKGVCWNTSTNPSIGNFKSTDGIGTGAFTSSLTGLAPNTTYYVKAYATNSVGTAYGNEITFKTLADAPTVTTNSITNVTANTASGGGNVTLDNGSAVTARGVCWSTAQNPTTALTTKTSDGSGTGNFNSQIAGLTSLTTYYVRAYATNSYGTSYGTQLTFTTISNLPTITTSTLTNITSISATGGGIVVSDGGSTVTERGLCWGTSQLPTTSDSKLVIVGSLGSFSGQITGLQPGVPYYVRAYAINSAGTAYGNVVNGLTADVNNLIDQKYIDELRRLGMPINSGNTPPNVNCIINVTPFVMKNTNIPNDNYSIGYQINDERIQFSMQDNTKLTVQIDYVSGSSTTTSTGSFIVGSGNDFTIFSKTVTTDNSGVKTVMVEIFSGTVDTNSIRNFYDGIIMIDNGGDSAHYILNGQGRVFWDKDGVSEKVSSLKSAHIYSTSSSKGGL
jgi:hypothetical protein